MHSAARAPANARPTRCSISYAGALRRPRADASTLTGMRVLLVVCLLGCGVRLSALTVKPLTFTELVQESSAVVHGRVIEVRGQWTADRGSIESLVVVEVATSIKGALGDRVVVRVPGGQVGKFVNIIPGAPRF